ncbi:uncharacterized protein ARMOST_08245 [Armillaria ostoyae]|uniref:Integrase catalytic domain-containing protein n=1 Tax=Armillaria ostoyae TaxID=47428 RepID=A0A284R848_ARMOS|nr:uncharacterized protein ARMOST_08245 [Armillaria ostoyae]
MKEWSQSFNRIKEYVTFIETQYGVKPKIIRVDNAKELTSKEVKDWLKEKGIELQTSAPYAHSSNGVAERFNRTLIELTHAMLIARGLPSYLWEVAVEYAAYICNMAPTRALEKETPDEAWTREKPDVSHLREFGSDVWVLTEGKNLSKLEAKLKKYIFVGYLDGPKAIRYYDPQSCQIRVSRNFIFAEPSKTAEFGNTDNVRLEGETQGTSDPKLPVSADEEQGQSQNDLPMTSSPGIQPKSRPGMTSLPPGVDTKGYPRQSSRNIGDHDYQVLNNPNVRISAAPRSSNSSPMPIPEHTSEQNFANFAAIQSYLAGAGDDIKIDNFPRSVAEAEASPEWAE